MTISTFCKKIAAIVPVVALGLSLAAAPAHASSVDDAAGRSTLDAKSRIIWVC